MGQRVWVISELYYPEETSTGYLLTKTAEGLAERHSDTVLTEQPTYAARGARAPSREVRHNVRIFRCRATAPDKDVLPFRLVNLVSISLSIFAAALRRIRRDERVLVVTNPPLLPFLVAHAFQLRREKCLLLIHDVYPEALVATGLMARGS